MGTRTEKSEGGKRWIPQVLHWTIREKYTLKFKIVKKATKKKKKKPNILKKETLEKI